MATLEPGQTLRTREPVLSVDGSYKPGRHRFQLVVIRNDKQASQPDTVVVEITESLAPRRPLP